MSGIDAATLAVAVLMPLVTFALGRVTKARDRNRLVIEQLVDDVRDIGEDVRDGFRQLADAMPTFTFRPRSRPRRRGEPR